MADKLRVATILPLALDGVGYVAGGNWLVRDLSCQFLAGGVSVILGPNGAGKSVTLRLCHGLLEPSAGSVRWCGPEAARAARRQAMVFQRPVLLRRSAARNIAYALAVRGVPRAQRAERVAEGLRITNLEQCGPRPARSLSAGEQQRLALARAWSLKPEVLFLDEPTASLDPAATRGVEAVIQDIAARGVKIVMTTHDLAQARRFAREVLFLHRGTLLERGPAAAFFESPATEEGRAFLAGELLW